MNTLTGETFNRVQNIVEFPRNKQEEYLSQVLNALSPEQFDEVVNNQLSAVTPQAVRTYGMAFFEKLDTRPNPPDGVITIDEVSARISRSNDAAEQAVLLYIWLYFDNVRRASDDFKDEDKLFDYVLTRADFEQFS